MILIYLILGIIATGYLTGDGVFKETMQIVTNKETSIANSPIYLMKKGFDLEAFKSEYTIETIHINSTLDGHMIPADYITANGDKNSDTIVLVHGLWGNRLTVYPMAKMFLEKGYNVIAYDQRSSGDNTALYTTFGYWESHDLGDYVAYLNTLVDEDKSIGIWGTSFGGATVGIYLGSKSANDSVNFAILDCPVSNMRYLISREMEKMNMDLPVNFMMAMGNLVTKAKLGFSYDDTDVNEYIRKTNVPVLIINTKADQITPYFMGEDIYHSISHTNKKIFTVDDSEHANIFYEYNDLYEHNVMTFIKDFE
nr:alpha/beta hydrolase [Alkalibaculum sporogenes]